MELEYFRPVGKNTAINITLLAIMTALSTVVTYIIRIPYPGTGGYFNLGDTMVMLGGLLLGPVGGFFAGGVGSALADAIGGYTFYIPITFVAKGLEGMAVGFFSFKVKEYVRWSKWDFVGVLIGAAFMLTGYFVPEMIFFGIPYALGELVIVNLPQVTIGGAVALIIGPIIRLSLRSMGFEQIEPLKESVSESNP
jgi:uncharacterized membrane protein